MAANLPPSRLLLALTDEQLEEFVREWVGKKKEYVAVERFTGAGDKGRDVVGYLTDQRLDGPWHNYQCKQYNRAIPIGVALVELGKLLYHASVGDFAAPSLYYFVAPRGLSRTLERLIAKPSELKSAVLEGWYEHCAEKIASTPVDLTPPLRAFIESWDFALVRAIKADDILTDSAATPVLKKWFDLDPGPAPTGVVPDEIESRELPYVQQLVDAYAERAGIAFDHAGAQSDEVYGPHLSRQRERFFDADAFARFYRDNTMQEEIEVLRRDVRHGIAEVHEANHDDSLARADAVMTQAGNVQVSGALSRHARVPVKQGICHHFANEGSLKWRK